MDSWPESVGPEVSLGIIRLRIVRLSVRAAVVRGAVVSQEYSDSDTTIQIVTVRRAFPANGWKLEGVCPRVAAMISRFTFSWALRERAPMEYRNVSFEVDVSGVDTWRWTLLPRTPWDLTFVGQVRAIHEQAIAHCKAEIDAMLARESEESSG